MAKQRVIVYVDGFNFYYGLKNDPKWKRYYWLDIVGLFERFMKDEQELVAVKYSGLHITQMQHYEARFRQSVLPDDVTLCKSGFVLHIPPKWKAMQPQLT